MKNATLPIVISFGICFISACSTSKTASTSSDSATVSSPTVSAPTAPKGSPIDSTGFARIAASSDMFELLSSYPAKDLASHADVKMFADHIIADHSKSSHELLILAASKNIILPTSPLPMHHRMLQNLYKKYDKKFDEEYMQAQVKAHEQAVALFENASANETDPELKAFAQKTLPTLKMHLDMAKKTKEKVD